MELNARHQETPLGILPDGWSTAYVEDVARITTGSKNTQDRIEDGQYPFFVRSQTVERINSYSFDGEAVLTAGDGVGTGKIYHYIDGKFDVHQRVYRMSDFTPTLNGYFFFLAFSNLFYERIMQMTAKSSVDSVRREMIARMQIPLPPLREQEAIAEALSDADALIESLEQLIAKKRLIKQGVMQELLTGKRRLPGFEGVWGRVTFGQAFDFLSTATNPRSDLNPAGDCFYIHYGDIHTKFHSHLNFSTNVPPRIDRVHAGNAALIRNGDWIMADASEDYDGVGKTVEVVGLEATAKAVAGLHTFLLRDRGGYFAPGFKGHLGGLHSLHQEYLRVATGMKVYGVSKSALRDLALPVPDIAEQQAIAEVLSAMDAELSALVVRRDKARQLKQGMMQQLLTGRIRLV